MATTPSVFSAMTWNKNYICTIYIYIHNMYIYIYIYIVQLKTFHVVSVNRDEIFQQNSGVRPFLPQEERRNFIRVESITSWRKLFYKSNSLRRVTKIKNKRIPKVMLKCRPNGRKRLGRPIRLLDEAETGLSRPNWWRVMAMMMMWCQNIGDIQCNCAEWMVGGKKAGGKNSTEEETNMQYVTLLAIITLAQ